VGGDVVGGEDSVEFFVRVYKGEGHASFPHVFEDDYVVSPIEGTFEIGIH
jgi:hypothetical protein